MLMFYLGGLRKAYHLEFVNVEDSMDINDENSKTNNTTNIPNRYVAKMSVDPEEDRESYVNDGI